MKQGLFISIEGPDGSGKSTQIENIRQFFADKNIDILYTREPGGTEIGEQIRKILLDKGSANMNYMTEALLYAASRAQHVAQVIKPALREGRIVVCDRFVDSSIAYQGYGRNLGEAVSVINGYAVDGCMPDVTFFMKIDPSVGIERIRQDMQDRLDAEKETFHRAVYQGYLELEKENPDRIVGIDANRSIEEIKKEICFKLEELLRHVAL